MESKWVKIYPVNPVDEDEPVIVNLDHIISIEKKKWAHPELGGGKTHYYQVGLSNNYFFAVQEKNIEMVVRTMLAHQRIGQSPEKKRR